jgi:outer membrane immunogenic protein
MKKLLISAAALALTTGVALAADLPARKAEPLLPPPPPPMWTGFYAGLNAGYNFAANGNVRSWNTDMTPVDVGPLGPVIDPGPFSLDGSQGHSQSGFLGGAQIGYNYQWGSNFVLGVETDIQGAGVRGSSRVGSLVSAQYGAVRVPTLNLNSAGSTEVNAGLDYLGTVRGRVGYLVTPTLLVYGTGGFAYGGAYARVTQIGATAANAGGIVFAPNSWLGGGQQNQLLTGWAAGGGLEWMFMPNWSLKAEALYWDLGRMNVQTASFSAPPLTGVGVTSVSYSGVAARAGVNYHFTWGSMAPVVAKW